MEEECTTNENGKWKEDYDYIVYQQAIEKVINPNEPHRIRDYGHHGKILQSFINDPIAINAKLTEAEVASLRLYTGPLYIPWNTALRVYNNDNKQLQLWQTSISILYNAIFKLSFSSLPSKVYRGVNESRLKLPEQFYNVDGKNFAGGVELAFMSTSLDLNVAIEYAHRGETNECTIFEISFDGASRGASVQWVSQYPYENELLYPPYTYLTCNAITKDDNGVRRLTVHATVSAARPDLHNIKSVKDRDEKAAQTMLERDIKENRERLKIEREAHTQTLQKNLGTYSISKTLNGQSDETFNSINVSSNGEFIVSGSDDKTIKIWSIYEGSLLRTIKGASTFSWSGHSDEVTAISTNADGSIIISGSRDKTVKIWSKEGTLLKTLQGHEDGVTSVTISSDGNTIISGSYDYSVKLWSLDGKLLQTLEDHKGTVNSVSIGSIYASGSYDCSVKLWSLDGELLQTLERHDGAVNSVSVSADGSTIVSGSDDKTVMIWSADGSLQCTLKGHQKKVNSVSISAIDSIIVSGSSDKFIKIWSIDGVLLRTLSHGDEVVSVSITADGKTIISVSKDNIKIWSRST